MPEGQAQCVSEEAEEEETRSPLKKKNKAAPTKAAVRAAKPVKCTQLYPIRCVWPAIWCSSAQKVDADQGKKVGDPKSNVKCCYVTLEITNESAGYDEDPPKCHSEEEQLSQPL